MNALCFFCFQYACDSGNAKVKDSRNKIVNKGSGREALVATTLVFPITLKAQLFIHSGSFCAWGKNKKNKKPLCGFFDFFFPTRFVRALHSSFKFYLEIENLIGLGGVFNSKLDLWVLLKKGQRKGIFIYYYYLWINILFISHTDPRRRQPP
jgi:hypothetical protein